ncbi:hypothetical protein ACRYKZ_23965 [Escherichia coli]
MAWQNGKHFRHRCPFFSNYFRHRYPFFSNYHSNDLVSVFQQQTRKEELTRVEREAAKTKLRIDVYHRLRYVESDHVVFDPITGREVPAERACINKLIEALVDESNDISKRN